jgi:hypothetical protein
VPGEPKPRRPNQRRNHRRGFWRKVLLFGAAAVAIVVGLVVSDFLRAPPLGEEVRTESPPPAVSSVESPEPATPPTEAPQPVTADLIAGIWSGQTSQANGESFTVQLDIRTGCSLNERCGSISVSDVPCTGDLSLYAVSDGTYEFSVDDFTPDSGPACTPGAGEYLTPADDGTLSYTTGYDTSIQATLYRQP